ncbi:macro domain-containing protein [Chitinophaga horti]|uniref:Macro domain-containing protein n=1 Tax=Chitinophaga horti TaxID=2920382 RepID=A0ABY6IV65_9BACT|nr:macro domain-containing protein [Chitinophaga horti]UYQ91260.1 macro domain-containing protein [Chitinophaga horti]
MQYILIDTKPEMIGAWNSYFKDQPNVDIVHGDITRLNCDAIVSPANSFGFMDGGLDYLISERLGWDLEKELQRRIKALPEGELLVGTAMVVATGDNAIPFIISAPTMRVPTNFNIDTSVNAYLAMKAVLLHARQHDDIHCVAIPGLCTGVGRMSPIISARQMWYAFQEIELGEKQDFSSFGAAQKYHRHINPDGKLWH